MYVHLNIYFLLRMTFVFKWPIKRFFRCFHLRSCSRRSSAPVWKNFAICLKSLLKNFLVNGVTNFHATVVLRYVVLRKPKSLYKSSSDVFLLKFATKKFNFFWKQYSLLFCDLTFGWKISCSNCGWSWQVLCLCIEWCCVCCLSRFCCCCCRGPFVVCILPCVFSWFFNNATENRTVVCFSIKYLINSSC